jgi:hypothetical protein
MHTYQDPEDVIKVRVKRLPSIVHVGCMAKAYTDMISDLGGGQWQRLGGKKTATPVYVGLAESEPYR